MRILIDTNILIPLEDNQELVDRRYADLSRLASKYGCDLVIHPASRQDIERDKDTARRQVVLSKLSKYNLLDFAPEPGADFFLAARGNPANPNDIVDTKLLFAVQRDAVSFLVTEDRGIHKRAGHLGIAERVYYVDQCLVALRQLYEPTVKPPPNVVDEPLHNLPLSDPFFDSLKIDYPDFVTWFRKTARAGRHAWVYRNGSNELGGLCIYKSEESPLPRILSGPCLKLCTFKVAESARGQRCGELLLKTAFQFCVDNEQQFVYVTVLPRHQYLIAFFQEFGFAVVGDLPDTGEHIMAKGFSVEGGEAERLTSLEYNMKFYPHFRRDAAVRKFLVPIMPQWHKLLFPERQHQLSLFITPAGNAIRKAYISNSKTNQVRSGDLLLFYRSHDAKEVTTLGLVERAGRFSDPEDVAAYVGKRTVYSYNEIRDMCHSPALAILFRQIRHLPKAVPFDWLRSNGVVRNHLESITTISDDSFEAIAREALL